MGEKRVFSRGESSIPGKDGKRIPTWTEEKPITGRGQWIDTDDGDTAGSRGASTIDTVVKVAAAVIGVLAFILRLRDRKS